MRRAWFGWIGLCAVATSGCRAPSPDWNGTWKLNPTKSSYQGQVLTISISADGEYRFDEKSSHTLRCDGKHRPIGNDRSPLCVKSGLTALEITLKENGVKTRATHDELRLTGRFLRQRCPSSDRMAPLSHLGSFFCDCLGPMVLQASGGIRATCGSMPT